MEKEELTQNLRDMIQFKREKIKLNSKQHILIKNFATLISVCSMIANSAAAQSGALRYFPRGTQLNENIAYAQDTLKSHQLDIYLPNDHKRLHPVIFWLHSGGWRAGDKEGDMHNMPRTLHALVDQGYAIVAINYRYSTASIFPAQINDCNTAMNFVLEHAAKYKLDSSRIALMGFSAGGHLAALMGLSENNQELTLYSGGKKNRIKISAVVDYYGLSDFYLIPTSEFKKSTNGPGLLFGGPMIEKPDLVKKANPVSYVDSLDPAFLIIHGKKDEQMDVRQSISLNDTLTAHHVKSTLILVDGAPHGGAMFDSNEIRLAVISFLKNVFKV